MALDPLIARANIGAGTDTLAGRTTGGGFVGAVMLTDDAGVEISTANPMKVQVVAGFGLTDAQLRAAPLPLPAGAAAEATLAALSAKFVPQTSIPDNLTAAIPVRPIGQDTWAVSFSNVGAGIRTPELTTPRVGTGVAASQAGSALLITTGTATNAEFLTRSVAKWRSTMLLRYSFVASQRIANQNFAVLLADLVGEGLAVTVNSTTSITVALPGHGFTADNVGQGMFVGGISGVAGVPGRWAIASVIAGVSISFTVAGWPASGTGTVDLFGHTHVKHLHNGVTPTSMLVDGQRRGWASGDTAVTVNTSAAPGHIMQCEIAGREVYWSDMLRASSLTPNVTLRGSRVENLPDDNTDLYVFLWSFNGITAPVSTTTWTIGMVAVERFANVPVYIQGQELQGAKSAAPVAVVGTAAVSGTVNATVGASISGGTISPLTVAGVSIEASSAKIASGNGATITNASGNAMMLFLNCTAVSGTTLNLVVRVQVQDPVSLAWVDLPGAAFNAVTGATATPFMLIIAPGVVAVANAAVNLPLPRTWRVAWTISGTSPSLTFSVGAQYII